VGLDADRKRLGSHVIVHVAIDVVSDLGLNTRQVTEPAVEFLGHPDPRQIWITPAVSEPTTHLEQSVVSACRPDEVADDQTFESESPGKSVPADRDRDDSLTCVVESLVATRVVEDHLRLTEHVREVPEERIEVDSELAHVDCRHPPDLCLPQGPELVEELLVLSLGPGRYDRL